MDFRSLKEKALSLPYEPGVYIMRDKTNTVIYVGKAKKLKNRVSQYFQDTASHTPKTKKMVSMIDHFDYIVARTEFEALVLECSLIKRYMPKYNILLKDDKGYPYIRYDSRELYPKLTIANKLSSDGAAYFGPFGNRGATTAILDTIRLAFKLPGCTKIFPRDIGKERPCLNYRMGQCDGWCREDKTCTEYRETMEQVKELLAGNYQHIAAELRKEMLDASDRLDFENAARLRDRLQSVEALGKKQLVTARALSDTDIIGYFDTGVNACMSVLHYSKGNLLDKDMDVFPSPDDSHDAVSGLIKQYYSASDVVPALIFLPFEIEDSSLFSDYLTGLSKHSVHIRVPERGENAKLVLLANKNAQEEAERITDKSKRVNATLAQLGKMLAIKTPKRIESYDISNISGTDIVAGMVVFIDGKPKRSEYKKFKIEGLDGQDDYASMNQVITRRFSDLVSGKKGFTDSPDLLLIDGGAAHAGIALNAISSLGIQIPTVGMVKDNRHRTRALVFPDNREIAIDNNQAVFSLIGTIQEETHRFAITYHRNLRSKRLSCSELDGIAGVGQKRKEELLKRFKSIQNIREAEINELRQILPENAAESVYSHFHKK